MNRFNASHLQLAPPRTPAAFEDLCLDLFRALWNDNYAKKNGRNGQGQHGVDIYSSNLSGAGITGVQCKNKDLQLNSNLTVEIIDEEIRAAKTFKPALSRFVIVTVDPKDAALEEHVRVVCAGRIENSEFSVEIMFWDDLVPHLGDHPAVADKHLGTTWDQSKAQESSSNNIQQTDENAIISGAQGGEQIARGDGNIQISNRGNNVAINVQSDASINSEYQQEVNHARELLHKYRFHEALDYLVSLKERVWATANDYIKFRILTNIASAQYSLQMNAEAAANFLEAYGLQSDDIKAQSNKALAYLLKGDYQEAIKLSDKILELHPDSEQALSIKIQAMAWLKKPYKEITQTAKGAPSSSQEIQYALSFAAQKSDKKKEVIKYLRAANTAEEKNPHVMADLAIMILETVIEGNKPVVRGMLNRDQQAQVEEAIKLLEEAWSLVGDVKDQQYRTEWLYNLSVAYRLIDNKPKTKDLSDQLLQLKPNNDLYVRNASVVAFESGEYTKAESYLNTLIKRGSKIPELMPMLADALKGQNRDGEAIKTLKDFIGSYGKKDSLWSEANQSLFAMYTDAQQYEEAEKLAKSTTATPGYAALGLMLYARIEINKQNSDNAKSYVEQAYKALTGKEHPSLKIDLAETAYRAGAFEIAAKFYKETINPYLDNAFTRRYLHSLYEIRQYQQVIDIAERIRKDAGATREITQYEWAAYQELEDLNKARQVLKEYIKQHPEDEQAKLRLALTNIRTNKTKDVDTYLASNIELSKLDLFSLIQLSNLYTIRNKPIKTIETMYFARKRFINEADAHSAYVSLLLGFDDKKTKKFEVSVVQPDTAIIYDGGHFLIEDDDPKAAEFEISSDEATKRGFMGKKVGDKIVASSNHVSGDKKVEIKEIKSKYIFALHDSMQSYERRFVNRNDLMGFNVDKNNFDPLFKQLDAVKEQGDQVERFYKQNKITVDLFAKLVGRELIEVIYALRQTPDLGIRVAKGTDDEAKQGRKNFLESKEVVVDITAIITLHSLGIKPEKIGLQKFIIGQKTRDLLTQKIHLQETVNKRSRMTLYKDKSGKYVREKVTAADHRRRLKALKDLAKWIDNNTITKPITQSQIDKLNAKAKNLKQLEDVIESSQLDAITLALEDGRVLLCDDAGLRDLAISSFGARGVWTQIVLQVQLVRGKVTEDDYKNFVIQLANSNYHHVGIGPDILLEAAKQAGWLPKYPLEEPIKLLSRPETTLQSIIIVLANFFYELYKQPTLVDKSYVVNFVLDTVTKNHDRKLFLPVMRRAIEVRFKLVPSLSKELLEIIGAWERLHSLQSSY
jgi:tetratricopeptide (TPR) repeat protein